MTMATPADQPDYLALYARYHSPNFGRGPQAELRRAASLEDLTLQPALYRLFPGIRPDGRYQRLALLLPWVKQQAGAEPLAKQCARQRVSEARLLQIVRMDSPDDVLQLRRLLMALKPALDWAEFGPTVWFWGANTKRQLIESYYLTLYTPKGK